MRTFELDQDELDIVHDALEHFKGMNLEWVNNEDVNKLIRKLMA